VRHEALCDRAEVKGLHRLGDEGPRMETVRIIRDANKAARTEAVHTVRVLAPGSVPASATAAADPAATRSDHHRYGAHRRQLPRDELTRADRDAGALTATSHRPPALQWGRC
jgi:hypothetical protein